MGVQLSLILTALVHLFGLLVGNKIDYNTILKKEVASGQQAFGAMREELQIAQIGNAYKKRRFNGMSSDVGKDVIAIKRETNETYNYNFVKEPYIFPEIHDGNALQPTLDLLLSQQQYWAEMDRIFQNMEKKNPNANHLNFLRALLMNSERMMSIDVNSVQEYLTTGAPDDETKRQPWCGGSSFSILNTWRKIKEWSEKMRNERVDEEIDAMVKVVDAAIGELEIYEKYADIFYEQMKTTTEMESESLFEED